MNKPFFELKKIMRLRLHPNLNPNIPSIPDDVLRVIMRLKYEMFVDVVIAQTPDRLQRRRERERRRGDCRALVQFALCFLLFWASACGVLLALGVFGV